MAGQTASQTELILGALSKPHQLRLLVHLSRGPATEKSLRDDLNLEPSAASHALGNLRLVGLINRPSTREPYELVLPGPTTDLIQRVNALALLVVADRTTRETELREALPSPDAAGEAS